MKKEIALKQECLHLLVGKKLTKVEFVLDYVTFQFEEFSLDSLSKPKVLSATQDPPLACSAYNSQLEALLGLTVTDVRESPRNILVSLSNHQAIEITDQDIPAGNEFAALSGQGEFFGSWISER